MLENFQQINYFMRSPSIVIDFMAVPSCTILYQRHDATIDERCDGGTFRK